MVVGPRESLTESHEIARRVGKMETRGMEEKVAKVQKGGKILRNYWPIL